MHIDHIAIWTNNLEKLRDFYAKYFKCKISDLYNNPKKQFSSYFLSFESGARIEIMTRHDITNIVAAENIGLAHFAIEVGSIERVNTFTKELEEAGVIIYSYPRTTGDGCYESVILDPDNNKIELIAGADSIDSKV